MTTSRSPLSVLQAQANTIAKTIKAAERGEPTGTSFDMAKARASGKAIIGIFMDDKLVTLTIPLATISESSEAALAAYILRHMKGERSQ